MLGYPTAKRSVTRLLLASMLIAIMIIGAISFTSNAATSWFLQGFNLDTMKWTSGNVKGWMEDDDVYHRLVALSFERTGQPIIVYEDYYDNAVPPNYGFDSAGNFFVGPAVPDAVNYEDIDAWIVAFGLYDPSDPDNPSNTGLIIAPGALTFSVEGPEVVPNSSGNIMMLQYTLNPNPSNDAAIMDDFLTRLETAYADYGDGWAMYWTAHMAVTDADTHGASYWTGASLHSHTDRASMDLPISVPPKMGTFVTTELSAETVMVGGSVVDSAKITYYQPPKSNAIPTGTVQLWMVEPGEDPYDPADWTLVNTKPVPAAYVSNTPIPFDAQVLNLVGDYYFKAIYVPNSASKYSGSESGPVEEHVVVFQPAIDILKSGDTLSKIGDPVDYTITVKNLSSPGTPDLSIHITDAMLGINQTITMAVGDPDYVIQVNDFIIPEDAADPFINTVYAEATVTGFAGSLTDNASWATNLFQPGVTIDKTGDELSKVGDMVTYTFTITNTSSEDAPDLILDYIMDDVLGDLTAYVEAEDLDVLDFEESGSFDVTYTILADDPDPLVNTVEVHYHPEGFDNDIWDDDTHSVNLFQPALSIDKTGDTLSKIGDPVDYVITVHNTSSSDTPDMIVTVTDAVVGVNETFTLASGLDNVINVNGFVIPESAADPFVNTASFSASPVGFPNTYTGSASWSTNLFQPAIELVKTGDRLSKIGDPVSFTITLYNNSSADTPDLTATVTDAMLGVNETFTIASGANHPITVSNFIIPIDASDPFVNTASVTASPAGFPNVYTDEASWSINLFQPAIELVKTGVTLSKIGDPVDFTITLYNNSSADTPDLTATVTDTMLGVSETFTIASGANHPITVSNFIIPSDASDPFVNTASVTASPAGFTNVYTDEASWSTNLFQPGVTIVKTGDELSKVGDTVTYTFTITNTSSADAPDLILDSIMDDVLGDLTSYVEAEDLDRLGVAETGSFDVTYTVLADDPDPLVNTVEVHYHPEGFENNIWDDDTHSVNLFQPAIDLDLTGNELSKIGDDVTFTVTAYNDSSSDTPPMEFVITIPALSYSKTVTIANGDDYSEDIPFTIPASASDPFVVTASVTTSFAEFDNIYSDSDDHAINLFVPGVMIEKSGPTSAKVGEIVTYTYTITNMSTSDAPDLILDSLVDDVVGDLAAAAAFAGLDVLSYNESGSFTATYIVQADDPNPLVNIVTAHYHPEDFPNDVTDDATWSLTIVYNEETIWAKLVDNNGTAPPNVYPFAGTGNWGYYAGPFIENPAEFTFELWAGQANNDPDKGEKVGYLTFMFDEGCITYSIEMLGGIEEPEYAHIYIGYSAAAPSYPQDFVTVPSEGTMCFEDYSGEAIYFGYHSMVFMP